MQYLAAADGRVTPDEQAAIDAMEALMKTVVALTPAEAADPKPIQGAPASDWLDLRGYNPAMADDFVKWKTALGGKAGVTFDTYPALNHLFLEQAK